MKLYRDQFLEGAVLYRCGGSVLVLALTATPILALESGVSISERVLSPIYQNLGHLILTGLAIWLAYRALRGDKELRKRQLEFEQHKFEVTETERRELAKFREQEYKRFAQPAADLAEHLANKLIEDPHWAYRALEAAKLLPYRDTLFDERTRHFQDEKQELATRFTPYLLSRCKHLILQENRDVWLLIDAGTTLYPFFEIIGKETAKLAQKGEAWLSHIHLATNNLPGIEQIIKSGRRTPWDRYSKLAIENCILLPGIPIPIFAAVAGNLTNQAICDLRKNPSAFTRGTGSRSSPVFIALVVGNWIRIRLDQPRCPIPMARGAEHRAVKQQFIDNADEIFVVSPLGKVFVDASNDEVNQALGFKAESNEAETASYADVEIDEQKAKLTKLVTTTRSESQTLYRHSCRVEDALTGGKESLLDEDQFASRPIEELSHTFFAFHKPRNPKPDEFSIEFPHYHTRTNKAFLKMFSAEEP